MRNGLLPSGFGISLQPLCLCAFVVGFAFDLRETGNRKRETVFRETRNQKLVSKLLPVAASLQWPYRGIRWRQTPRDTLRTLRIRRLHRARLRALAGAYRALALGFTG